MRCTAKSVASLIVILTLLSVPLAAQAPKSKPEDVGLSSERLKRVHELIQRHLDAGNFSGAVTLVARNGRIAHLEAHGLMDIEAKKPMATNAMFRIMSMTKPVVGVATLMMIEEGKVRLTDPISRFIPEFKNIKVGVLVPASPAAAGQRGARLPRHRPQRRRRQGNVAGNVGQRHRLSSIPFLPSGKSQSRIS
jgi:CubicO group peptidase (beta-lactamase class C family)